MHKKAYHRIRTSDGKEIEGPVCVQTDNEGGLVTWHTLTAEEPYTIWIGGTLQVSLCFQEAMRLMRK